MTSNERNKTVKPAGAFFGTRMMKFGVFVFIGVGKRTEKQSGAREEGEEKKERKVMALAVAGGVRRGGDIIGAGSCHFCAAPPPSSPSDD